MVEPSNIEPTDIKPTDIKPTDIRPTDIKPTDIGPTQSQGIGQPREFRCPKCGGHLSEIPSSQPLLDGFLGRNIVAKCDTCGMEVRLTEPKQPGANEENMATLPDCPRCHKLLGIAYLGRNLKASVRCPHCHTQFNAVGDRSTGKVRVAVRIPPVIMVFAVVVGLLLGLLIVGLVEGFIPNPFAGGGSWDGTYSEVCVWQIPGDEQRTASYTLTVVDGEVTGNPIGTVESDGTFTGVFVFGAGIPDLPVTGKFSKTDQFTLSGRSGQTTWEATVRKQ